MSSVEIGLRTEQTPSNQYGWEIVDNVPADQVCVVYLGGDNAKTDKAANGYAKSIDRQLQTDFGQRIAVYSIKYEFDGHNREWARKYEFLKHRQEFNGATIKRTKENVATEEMTPQYVDVLYKKLIEPRISVHGKIKISAEEACRRMRMMTFVAHCHGGYVALKLEEKMQAEMKKLGYSLEERNKIQAQMLVLAHAPACALGISKSQMISFRTVYDRKIPAPGNFFNNYIKARRAEEGRRYFAEETGNMDAVSQNRRFDFEPCFFEKKQGNLFMIKQRYPWNDEGPMRVNDDEHGFVDYFNPGDQTKDGAILTAFCRCILYNGVKNSLSQIKGFEPLPSIEKLILPPVEKLHARYTEIFDKMRENGKKFRAEVYKWSRDCLRQTNTQEQV